MYQPHDILPANTSAEDRAFEACEQAHYDELVKNMAQSSDDAGHVLFAWDSDFSDRLTHTIAKNLQSSDLILATAIRSLFSEEVYKWAQAKAERDLK